MKPLSLSNSTPLKVVLLRVGIDTGSGGMHGPIFSDSTFEFVPIPDYSDTDPRKYGNTKDRSHDRLLVDYFPESRHRTMMDQSIPFDPEFDSFTYGDPTSPKARLRTLLKGDLLVFYAGLEGWDFRSPPALYIIGYLEIDSAGRATELGERAVKSYFGSNFHVRHPKVLREDWNDLVLVRGGRLSRVLSKAYCISSTGRDRRGRSLKVLSPQMRKIFGDFDGKISIQRSPPRWVNEKLAAKAADFVRSLDD